MSDNEMLVLLKLIQSNMSNTSKFIPYINNMIKTLGIHKSSSQDWKIEETDAWEDLLLLGTEVNNSCLHITKEAYHNQSLLACICDGKNKAIVVRSEDGSIVARAILRILWDDEKKLPVLFLEKLYFRVPEDIVEPLICKVAIHKAKMMGLSLLVSQDKYLSIGNNRNAYQNEIKSFYSPAPFEYIDAQRFAFQNGVFTITKIECLYDANQSM